MATSRFSDLVISLYKIVKDHEKRTGDYKKLFGESECYRNLFAGCYDKDAECPKLEDMAKLDKEYLWKDSSVYAPLNRLEWCKAVRYYESLR